MDLSSFIFSLRCPHIFQCQNTYHTLTPRCKSHVSKIFKLSKYQRVKFYAIQISPLSRRMYLVSTTSDTNSMTPTLPATIIIRTRPPNTALRAIPAPKRRRRTPGRIVGPRRGAPVEMLWGARLERRGRGIEMMRGTSAERWGGGVEVRGSGVERRDTPVEAGEIRHIVDMLAF
jgi:hypothetical protein